MTANFHRHLGAAVAATLVGASLGFGLLSGAASFGTLVFYELCDDGQRKGRRGPARGPRRRRGRKR